MKLETLTVFMEKLKQVKEQHGGFHKSNGSERTDHKPDRNLSETGLGGPYHRKIITSQCVF